MYQEPNPEKPREVISKLARKNEFKNTHIPDISGHIFVLHNQLWSKELTVGRIQSKK
ncbi:hypothetical protein MARINOS108_10210 [Marinoscillum sp. 108]|nr:hypothetical protein MARINOS108_10210 [Marinoscillum sp. 108]